MLFKIVTYDCIAILSRGLVASVLQLIGMFESSFILTGDMDGVPAGSYYDPLRNGKQAPVSLDEVSITEDEEGDDYNEDDDEEGDVRSSVSIKNPNDRMRLLSSDLLLAM